MSLSDFYDEMYEQERKQKEDKYNRIISEFSGLSLEEKVNKLIEAYAWDEVYG